jgi:type IV secretion system protein TrbL
MVLFDLESIKNGLKKLLVISLWMYTVQDFDRHATNVVDSLVRAGFIAAGRGFADPRAILNPSRIIDRAFQVTSVLQTNMPDTAWYEIGDIFMRGIANIFIFAAFFALALNAFMAVLEHYLAMAVAGILLPFGVLQPTRWLAMKPISYVVSSGLKLMVLAFIMTITQDVILNIRFAANDEPTDHELWTMVFVCGTMALIAWIAPQRLAAGFMAGSASLGGDDAVRGATAAAATTVMVARSAAGPASAVAGMAQAGARFIGAAKSKLGSAPSSGASGGGGGASRAPGFSPLAASTVKAAPNAQTNLPQLGTQAADSRRK